MPSRTLEKFVVFVCLLACLLFVFCFLNILLACLFVFLKTVYPTVKSFKLVIIVIMGACEGPESRLLKK